ncbi:hypothetical protein [Streptomyces zhihengii]|uniref:Uncharacterized protein n=1 Tax=Streptomyces zhihengii TaxID=1818004 RepID=A0ABS2UKZ7_9ACTN|nr:hypothetical protein [Streptomyces zhihengii]MBM9617385.1 hypothetical protein [Streptomyces zhihengii]
MTASPAAGGVHPTTSFWAGVRRYAVPATMIETATARRLTGDWAGACAAAGIDTDLRLRPLAREYGREFAAALRDDLRHLAPDLLRWHMPRIAPDGLLRPGLTVSLGRYETHGRGGPRPVHLVARTPPAWADAGQRIGLALWDADRTGARAGPHPHPHPSPRFRLDLHRHLWDARRSGELRTRAGSGAPADDAPLPPADGGGRPCAADRWADEARILLRSEGLPGGGVLVRLTARHRLLLATEGGALPGDPVRTRITPAPPGRGSAALPVLPDAATWVPPDVELLRTGAITPGALHPLVAAALVPEHTPPGPHGAADRDGRPDAVDCRGARHRIALVDGVLTAVDHDPAEIRREELLAALGGPPLPCLRAIDEAHRRPQGLTGIRERLDHGDTGGALAVVEALLGSAAVLPDGPLLDELHDAARRRITYGLYRAGLIGDGPVPTPAPAAGRRRRGRRRRDRGVLERPRPDGARTRPRLAHR